MKSGTLLYVLSACAEGSGPVVQIRQGRAEGVDVGNGVGEWKGLPYAQPPVGDLRWRPPLPAETWGEHVWDASGFGPSCVQNFQYIPELARPASQSEDCLFLNVYAPLEGDHLRPVLFWSHGGAYQGGGGNETRLNGTWDVALTNGELVVVTSNFRLNVFGFAASDLLRSRDPEGSTGNYGIQDQRMAMRWVQESIQAFRGDPSRVLLIGQSSGAKTVSQHLVRSQSWGLFSRAGIESGAFNRPEDAVEDLEDEFASLLKTASCLDVDCLINLAARDLLDVSQQAGHWWMPAIDGVELPTHAHLLAAEGHLAPVPVLVGSVMEDEDLRGENCEPELCTEDDFKAWWIERVGFNESEAERAVNIYADESPRPNSNANKWWWAERHAAADQWGTCPARRAAKWVTTYGQSAFWYYWTYPPMNQDQYAHHACEQPFVFHVLSETPAELADLNGGTYHIQPEEVEFSAEVAGYWASFAASGQPEGSVSWPQYPGAGSDPSALVIGDEYGSLGSMTIELVEALRSARCDLWDDHFLDAAPGTLFSTNLASEAAAAVV